MSNRWKEVEDNAVLNGTELPALIKETNDNYEVLETAMKSIEQIQGVLGTLRYAVGDVVDSYDIAKNSVNSKELVKINKEAGQIKTILDSNFETTLNGLMLAPEISEEERVEYLKRTFTIPLIK